MRTITTLILVVITTLLFAQNDAFKQTIRGTVYDKITQSPLPGASVIVLNTNPLMGTTTDANGKFKFNNIPVGRHNLQVSFIGYNTTGVKNVLLTSGKQLVLNIELEEQAFVTEEVVIKAEREKANAINEMATVSARTFSVEETERYAGSLGDPSRMAANFAGVSMVNDQRNDIVIRGNSPTGVLWRLDGVEIPNPNHFGASGTTGGPVSMLNNNLLTNSDFFTSAFPAEYGNAMSGVFDLKMRSGNNEKREYVAQVGFNGFEFGAEGPFKKGGQGSYLVNYRYSTMGLMNAMGMEFGTGKAIPQYQDLTFKIDLPRTKLGRFSIFGVGGLSYIELYDSKTAVSDKNDSGYNLAGTDLDFGSDMGVIGISNLYFFNERTSLKTNISIQGSRASTRIDSLKFDSDGAIIPNSNYRFYDSKTTEIKYSASIHLKRKINSRNNVIVGFYYDLYNVTFIDSALVNTPEFTGYNKNFDVKGQIPIVRAYTQYQHKFSNSLTLNLGLYSQYVDISKDATIEPRVGIKYKITNKHTLSAGYGLHSQMQPRIYYFTQTRLDDGTYIKTNENMKLSKSHQYVLGYDYLISTNFRFKSEIYYQKLFNIPVSPSSTEFSMLNIGADFGTFVPDSLKNIGTGENYGIELTLEKFLSNNFYFLSTVSLFESKYKGYSKTERNTAFNNNYVINILGGYEFKIAKHYSLSVDIKGSYAGGKRYVPIDLEASKISNSTEYDWDNAYDNKYDDYFRTDVRISLKVDGKRINQEWAIDLQNVTNTQNIYSEAYNPRTQDISKTYQTGFFPMFLYRLKF